jgi:pseudouridine synthase
VEVAGELTPAETTQLLHGVRSDGEMLHAEKIFDVRHAGAATQLHLVLREGKKRQVRRMMAAVGHPVTRLTRVSIGSITLGNLKLGQWRYLTDEEVRQLVTA